MLVKRRVFGVEQLVRLYRRGNLIIKQVVSALFFCPLALKNRLKKTDIMELNELLPEVLSMECKLFMKMDSYRLIEQKCEKKCLAPDERQRLKEDIHYVFNWLIKTVKEACPSLTEEDIIFCCLTKSNLDSITLNRCMGSASMESIYQRKYRIKKKMHEAHCDDLFELIFSCHSSPVTCHY